MIVIGIIVLIVGIYALITGGFWALPCLAIGGILLVCGIVLKRKKWSSSKVSVTSTTNSSYSGYNQEKTFDRGILQDKSNRHILCTYKNGIVYFENTNNILGYYDNNGNVYTKDRQKIGNAEYRETADSNIFFDRKADLDYLKTHVYHNSPDFTAPQHNPGTSLLAAKNIGSYIEGMYPSSSYDPIVSIQKNASETPRQNIIGSSAAFIAIVYDNMMVDGDSPFSKLHRFWFDAQQDYFYRLKNPGIGPYMEYIKNTYGGVYNGH